MFNQSLFTYLVRAMVLLTAIPIHECAHAWASNKLGDPTAKNLGRLTLNPLPHPLYGDGKYGREEGRYRQALYSYKLKFAFDDDNLLSYLSGRVFQARDIKLLDDYKEKKFK